MAWLGGPAGGGGVTLPEKRILGSTLKRDLGVGGALAPLASSYNASFPIKLGRWNPSAYTALCAPETCPLVLGASFQEMNNNGSDEGEMEQRTNGSFQHVNPLVPGRYCSNFQGGFS